jgi:hypothetical protein
MQYQIGAGIFLMVIVPDKWVMILLEIQTKSLFNMFEMKGLRQKI